MDATRTTDGGEMTTPLVLHRQETEARGGSRSGVGGGISLCDLYICVIGGQEKGWRGGGRERERERERVGAKV